MVKNVQKCLRMTEEIFKIVDDCDGVGFNQKFENLVLDFKTTIPERERQRARLDKEILEQRKKLKKLTESIDKADVIKRAIDKYLSALEM